MGIPHGAAHPSESKKQVRVCKQDSGQSGRGGAGRSGATPGSDVIDSGAEQSEQHRLPSTTAHSFSAQLPKLTQLTSDFQLNTTKRL